MKIEMKCCVTSQKSLCYCNEALSLYIFITCPFDFSLTDLDRDIKDLHTMIIISENLFPQKSK